MRRFEGIIESTIPPISKNVLWIDKGKIKYNRNGQWVEVEAKEKEPIEVEWDDINDKPVTIQELGNIPTITLKEDSTISEEDLEIINTAPPLIFVKDTVNSIEYFSYYGGSMPNQRVHYEGIYSDRIFTLTFYLNDTTVEWYSTDILLKNSTSQSDWLQTNSTTHDYIKNKPTLATVATTGSYNDLNDKPDIPAEYTLPVATSNVLGGVKAGAGVNIASDGTISVNSTSGGNIQVLDISNWVDQGTATAEEIQTIKIAITDSVPLIVKNGVNTLTWQCVAMSNENNLTGEAMLTIDLVRITNDLDSNSYKVIGHKWTILEDTGTLNLFTANI